ncbi:hypothetical protein CP533_0435 [Ophiocordyceps camponoti-saundersi (nom. inval.)]|nr:hypothetical protein CP533_0435 [Ophiocordyceps camponoti-saundersi (nom. inval.)]
MRVLSIVQGFLVATATAATLTEPSEGITITDFKFQMTSSAHGSNINYVEFYLTGDDAKNIKCMSTVNKLNKTIPTGGLCSKSHYDFVLWPSYEGNRYLLEVFHKKAGSVLTGNTRPLTHCAAESSTDFLCLQGAPIVFSLRKPL